jgi:outer membrane autotransporter protein
MTTNAKKILLTGTALVAVSFIGIATAQAAVEQVGAGGAAITGTNTGVNFSGDGAGTVADGVSIAGPVTTAAAGTGTLQFAGSSNITGAVGAGGAIKAIAANGGVGKTVSFGSTVQANTLTMTANGTVAFNGNTTITDAIAMAAGSTISAVDGTLTATGGITGGPANGTIVLSGTGSIAGTGAINVATLTKTADAGVSTIANNVTAATVNVNGGSLALNGATNNITTLNMGGNGAAISGTALTLTNLNQTVAGTSTINNVVTVTNTGLSGGGTLNIASNGSNLGAVTIGAGGATLASTNPVTIGSITGNAGAANTATVSARLAGVATTVAVTSGTVDIQNADSTIASATLASGTTLTFGAQEITGAVTGTGGILNLNKAGAQTIHGVGTNGNALSEVILGGSGTKTLASEVYADSIKVGNVTVNAAQSWNGGVTFTHADGVVNVAGTANLTGNVSSNTGANAGTLAFTGTSAVNGNIGSSATTGLSKLDLNNAAGTVSVTGNVYSTAINVMNTGAATIGGTTNGVVNVSGTGSLTSAGKVTGNVNYTANGTLVVGSAAGAAADLDGAVDTNGANRGNLDFVGTGTSTISGAVGTTARLNRTSVAAGTLTFQNTTANTNLYFANNGTINLAADTATVGSVTNAAARNGTLNFSGTALTIDGALSQLNTLSLANSTINSPAPALTVKGNAVAADAMNIDTRVMKVEGTFATTENTALRYRVHNPTSSGTINVDGAVTVDADTAVNMEVDISVYVNQGQEFILINGETAAAGGVATLSAGKLTTTNTALLHFKQKTSDKNSLVVYADRTMMGTSAVEQNNKSVGSMLDQLAGGGDADITALQVRLMNFTNAADVEEMLAKVTPDVSGGIANATTGVSNTTGTMISNRVGAARSGEDFGTGMASGDWAEGGHFWGQVFGSTADQNKRDRVAGYEADSYGMVVGADGEVTDDFRAGLALTYGNTEVNGEDANRSQADIDSYQVSLYGDVDLGNDVFVTGQVAYMYSDIDTARFNVGGVAGSTARANFNSNQYSARAELGRKYALDNTFSLTPSALVNYSYLDVEDYTERGAGGLSLRNVDTDELQVLEFGANLIAEAKFADSFGGSIRPNIHAGYRYDVIGDNVATTAFLAGGGAAFKTEGFEPAQHTVNVGTGIKWETSANIDFTLNYDYEHKSDYEAHSGYVRAGYKF